MTLKEFNKKWLDRCDNFEDAEKKKVERYKQRKRKQLEKSNCKNIDSELEIAVMKYVLYLRDNYEREKDKYVD